MLDILLFKHDPAYDPVMTVHIPITIDMVSLAELAGVHIPETDWLFSVYSY